MTTSDSSSRESWGNHCEFFLSSLGLAVGLGNVWRFPFVANENGGGVFLIPYIVMLFVVGLPTFFLEQSIGQYGRVGANKIFGRMVPIFRGLGYSMILVRAFINVYYVIICAWSFFYLFAGMTWDLPWSKCDGDWNTYDCYSAQLDKACADNIFYKNRCSSVKDYCYGHNYTFINNTYCESLDSKLVTVKELLSNYSVSPAEDYFNGAVLGLTKDASGSRHTFQDYGSLRWQLSLCLLLTWVLICGILIKGLESYGKMSYVITLSPYFVLTALLGYSMTLKGSIEGVRYFFKPTDWSAMISIKVWASAASQIFFSLSVGLGSQLCLSSYNSFKNNTHRDAFIISICNSLTSIYAGVVVFAVLGFIAEETGTDDIQNVVKSGIALAFVSYPTAIVEMDAPPIWSFLFFFMMINLALSSVCGGVQTVLAFILDEKPSLRSHRTALVIGICCIFFLLGLVMCTSGGILVFTIFDDRCTSILLLFVLLEFIVVIWIYGPNKLFKNIEEMGMKLPWALKMLWKGLWVIVVPASLTVLTVLKWNDHRDMKYEDYVFPLWVQDLGWFIELCPLVFLFIWPFPVCYILWQKGNRGKELLSKLTSPSSGWYTVERENQSSSSS